MFKDHLRVVCRSPAHWKAQGEDFVLRHLKQRLNRALGKQDCFREEWPHVFRRTYTCRISLVALNKVDTAPLADVMRLAVCGAKNVDTNSPRRARRLRVVRLLGTETAVVESLDDSAKVLRRSGIFIHQGAEGARSARMCDERIRFQCGPPVIERKGIVSITDRAATNRVRSIA